MAAISGKFTCFSQVNCAIIGVCSVKETSSKSSKLLLTTNRSILLLSEFDTKPTQIWTSKPSQPLTCSAVCDASGQQYAACINHKLIVWDSATPDITKIKPSSVAGKIHRLYHLPTGGCALLYEDGAVCTSTIEQLKDTVQEIHSGFLKSDEVIVNSHLWCKEEDTFVVCLVEKSKQYSLCIIKVPELNQSSTGDKVHRVPLDTPSKCTLHETSICTSGDQLYMHSVWSNGQLHQSSISISELSHCKTLPCQSVIKLPVTDKQVKQVKLASIRPALVGVVGLGGEYTDHLCLWDTKFSTLVAKHSLQNSAEDSKATVSILLYASNRIWVSTNHGITAFGVDIAPSTLSMAFGKRKRTDALTMLPVNGEQWKIDAKGDIETSMDADDGSLPDIHELLQDICVSKTKTAKQFKTSVNKLLGSSKNISSVDMATMLGTSLRHVCDRYREDKRFWPKDGLIKILQSGLVAASSCPDFISCVVEKGDEEVLVNYLKHMQDIPDRSVALIIDFVLRELPSDGETMEDDSNQTHLLSKCPVSQESAELINLVLKCPMNDIFMLECIAKVKFQQIMMLLRYLYYRLNTINVDDQHSLPANVIMDWVILILDAHYSQLVLSAESRTVLLSLHHIVETLARYHDDADAVYEMLKHISYEDTKPQPLAATDSVYSIEILKI